MYRAQGKLWIKRYLKVMDRNIMTAFMMGFDDAASGRERQETPYQDTTPGTMLHAVTQYAAAAYNKGYSMARGDGEK